MRKMDRRTFVKSVAGAALALPFYELLLSDRLGGTARAAPGQARRVIFFYFPDGVGGWSYDGTDRWHATGTETRFQLSDEQGPLQPFQGDCLFFNGVGMGPYGEGSHPEGAKKLLTGTDGAGRDSVDRFLARTLGNGSPFPHLYLGVRATDAGQTDQYISYVSPGNTAPPLDNPQQAFSLLFGSGSSGGMQSGMPDPVQVSVIDGVLADMKDLRGKLGTAEKAKLDTHLAALRQVEQRIKGTGMPPGKPAANCKGPQLNLNGVAGDSKNWPDFPFLLRAQIDLLVLALSCGLSRVGVLQAHHHTGNDLLMSGFKEDPVLNTEPRLYMRSHEASHHGSDMVKFNIYLEQRRWFLRQFAYLLTALKGTPDPEGGGNMLQYSLVLLVTEISDGNVHSHSNMPFVLAGQGGGAVRTGRLLQFGADARHSGLLLGIAQACGQSGWGDPGWKALQGLLG